MFDVGRIQRKLEKLYLIDFKQRSGVNGLEIVGFFNNKEVVVGLSRYTADVDAFTKKGTEFIAFDCYSQNGAFHIACNTEEALFEQCEKCGLQKRFRRI